MRIDAESATTVAAILDEGSMDAAARRLRITPSAVSQRVKALERQLGRVLLIRSRPVTATSAGEAVARLGRQLRLAEHDALRALGVPSDDVARPRLPLAVNADSMATWFLRPMARIAREQSADIDLHRDDQEHTARLLEEGTVMAAVTAQAEPVAGCTVQRLGILAYEAVATEAYVQQWFPDGVTEAALRRAPFVDYDRKDSLQHDWLGDRGLDDAGIPRHYVPASADFAVAVRLGMGWGMLPVLQREPDAAGTPLVALGGATARVPLHWQRWDVRSPLLDAVSRAVIAEAAHALER